MAYGITRDQALELVKSSITNEHLVNHCLAAEAVLGALAKKLGENQEQWCLAGLLHDLDAERRPELHEHTKETVAILQQKGVDQEIIEAIRLHNLAAYPGEQRQTRLQHGLAAGETITGLIIAAALVNPAKKLAALKPKSVKKRFKEKAFARGANREIIAECEKLGISVADFCQLSLVALQEIADQIGL